MSEKYLMLTSNQPLRNNLSKIKKTYLLCLLILAVGILYRPLAIVGLLGLVIVYIVDNIYTNMCQAGLRRTKFQYEDSVTADKLFEKLQQSLISKYGEKILVEIDDDKKISITFNSHIYDIILAGDGSFTIWWRKSLSNALFSINDYKSYKQNLVSYGIIGYEIQRCCDFTEKGE